MGELTLGWHETRVPGDMPKVVCGGCSRRIRSGVSHPSVHLPQLCWTCWRAIMVEGRDPRGDAKPEWATESEVHSA